VLPLPRGSISFLDRLNVFYLVPFLSSSAYKLPMKNAIILIFCLFAYNTFAKPIEVDVISAKFNVEDQLQHPSLCLTVIRVPATGELLGVVEGLYDCFYARTAKRSPDHKIMIDLKTLKTFQDSELHNHLQMIDGQLQFLFSEGE
jgi:hypothetical protein